MENLVEYEEITIRYNSDERRFETVKVLQIEAAVLHDIEQIYLTNAKKIHPKSKGKYFKPVEVIGNTTSFGFTLNNNNRITGIGIHRSVFSTLPDSIGNLSSLQVLNLSSNEISSLPDSIGNLSSLTSLNLHSNKLTDLPESIKKLNSLLTLSLSRNQFKKLPESIIKLGSLRELVISGNPFVSFPVLIFNLKNLRSLEVGYLQLSTIPESIKNLSSLQELSLYGNQLISLPDSIGDLKSLKELNLESNRLTSLPESIYKLENLVKIRLNGNNWKGEWVDIEKKDIPTVQYLCRKLNGLNIFISHAWDDQEKYQVKAIKNYLENNILKKDLGKELNIIHKAFLCEESFIDDIQKFMKENVPKSNLLLFIATKNSITSEACRFELFLANKYDIEILPIKGMDIKWEDLIQITLIDLDNKVLVDLDLSNPKEQFELNSKNFKKIWKRLGNYITIHELELKKDREKEDLINIKSEIIEITNSQDIKNILRENLKDFDRISQELNQNQITSIEYCLKMWQLLNQRKGN